MQSLGEHIMCFWEIISYLSGQPRRPAPQRPLPNTTEFEDRSHGSWAGGQAA